MVNYSYREEGIKPLSDDDFESEADGLKRLRTKWIKEHGEEGKSEVYKDKSVGFAEKEKEMDRLDQKGSGRL